MFDTTINISNSKIQHGPKNNRIYLIHLQKEDMPKILDDLDSLANFYGYSKIFAKVPKASAKTFFEYGYISEAKISRFFNGIEDCIFMAKYMDNKRNTEIDKDLNRKVLDVALSKNLKIHLRIIRLIIIYQKNFHSRRPSLQMHLKWLLYIQKFLIHILFPFQIQNI